MARKVLRRTPTREVAEPTKRTRARAVTRPTVRAKVTLPARPTPKVAPAPKRPVRPTTPPVRQTPWGPKGTGFIPPAMDLSHLTGRTSPDRSSMDPRGNAIRARRDAAKMAADYFAGKATKEQALAAHQRAVEAARQYFGPQIGKGPSRPRGIVGRR